MVSGALVFTLVVCTSKDSKGWSPHRARAPDSPGASRRVAPHEGSELGRTPLSGSGAKPERVEALHLASGRPPSLNKMKSPSSSRHHPRLDFSLARDNRYARRTFRDALLSATAVNPGKGLASSYGIQLRLSQTSRFAGSPVDSSLSSPRDR